MYPDQIAKSGTEHGHQAALFCFAEVARRHGFTAAFLWADGGEIEEIVKHHGSWPVAALRWLHAIPNGGSRGDSQRSRAIQGSKLKAEGVKSGVPDVFLPYPIGKYSGLYIELKKPNLAPSGGLSKEQAEFGKFAKSVGYHWHCCYSWREAAKVLQAYLFSD